MTDAQGQNPLFAGDDPEEAASFCRGRADRIPVDAVVTLNAECGGFEGTTCDVSEQGLKIAIDEPIGPGPVTIKLIGMPIMSGEVRWRQQRYVGIRFEQPFRPDVLAHWLQWHGTRR